MSPAPDGRRRRPVRQRPARQRTARGASRVGERFEAEVGPIAHGGHCVVRLPEPHSRVVFVRHAIPGERVVLEITEGTEGDRFWRADAVEVLSSSPDRVEPPCPFAGPDRCGGCDLQHVDLAAQRRLKAAVVREQLQRLAGLDAEVVVEAVPGDEHGLRWRTRQQYVDLGDGRRGLRKHRSHEVVEVDDCRIDAHHGPVTTVHGTDFLVPDGAFWQVHPGAAAVLVDTVLELLAPRPGETALDLYAGVGLFARFLADAVGVTGRVVAIEGDRRASATTADNAPGVDATAGDVVDVLTASYAGLYDLVVLDPPRTGAKRAVVEQIVARQPRAVAYVACDPAALARDLAIFAELGYRLEALRAFDLFPMTQHVECVALVVPR